MDAKMKCIRATMESLDSQDQYLCEWRMIQSPPRAFVDIAYGWGVPSDRVVAQFAALLVRFERCFALS
jgi:hypothetical protein